MTDWRALSPALSAATLAAVDAFGFPATTPVQAATIPLFLSHKDVCVHACTGSGKTLAFLLPVAELLLRRPRALKRNQVGAMVITPTRELASQIFDIAQALDRHVGVLAPALLIGGTDATADVRPWLRDARPEGLRGPHLLVATPGRLIDVMDRAETLDVRQLEVLVLDEADKLLDMGFERQVNDLLHRLPAQRRTGLFSATQTREVAALARAGLRNPVVVKVEVGPGSEQGPSQETPTALTNFYTIVPAEEKLPQLAAFLREHADDKVIVFFATCATVDFAHTVLTALVPEVAGFRLHAKLKPRRRTQTYEAFVEAPRGALFCTDVAARGIDVPDVAWIVQFEPPTDPAFFVHRVGRTARAGRSGAALTLLLPSEAAYVDFLAVRRVPIVERAPADAGEDAGLLAAARELAKQDRDVLEKGTRAFVSFVRAYREHQCQFIFSFKQLDLGAVARGFALLKLPYVGELRGRRVAFEAATDVDVAAIPFRDPHREAQRQAQLGRRKEAVAAQIAERQRKKREREEAQAAAGPKRRKKSRHKEIVAEWDELAEEERLLKAYKKGKISKEKYERALMSSVVVGGSDSESESGGFTLAFGGSGSDSDSDSDGEDGSGGEEVAPIVAPPPKAPAPAPAGRNAKRNAKRREKAKRKRRAAGQ